MDEQETDGWGSVVYEATVVGVSALLANAFGEVGDSDLPGAAGSEKTRAATAADDKTPREVASRKVYRDLEGRLCVPGMAFMRLVREAGGNHKLRGTRRSLKYIVPSAVLCPQELIPLTNGDTKTFMPDFEVDSRPVVIPATRGRVMRHRPRYDCWSLTVRFELDTTIMAEKLLHQLLVEGGRRIGIGDFRPEKGGPFGRFRVTRFERVSEEAAA